jgi:hypothetical protein
MQDECVCCSQLQKNIVHGLVVKHGIQPIEHVIEEARIGEVHSKIYKDFQAIFKKFHKLYVLCTFLFPLSILLHFNISQYAIDVV